jgi:mRNA interferase MazF
MIDILSVKLWWSEIAMSLLFYPRAGQVFVCDFSGFKEPEMVKPRPIIVVSPRLPYRSEIAAIVPISLTQPRHELPFCYRLSKNYHPDERDDLPCWAKADMLMNIGLYRLSAFKVGRRQYVYPDFDCRGFGRSPPCCLVWPWIESR